MSFRPSFRTRALVYAALTANAIRPLPGFRAGVPSFFAGWITGEMAPHWLAVTTADAATHLTGKRRDPVALAIAGATAAGLGYLIHLARRDRQTAEAALTEALGADYGEQLDALPTPAEVRDAVAVAGQPVPDVPQAAGPDPGRAEHRVRRGRPPQQPRHLPARGARRERPSAAPGARRRVDHRPEGGAGHPADAAPGRQGLGLRRDQLPALAPGPVARPGRRREEGDPLDPPAHRGVRRRPRLHRHHRRLGRRPPHRTHRTHAQHSRVAARLRGRRHLGAAGDPPLRRLRPGRLDGHQARDPAARPVPRRLGDADEVARRPARSSRTPARSCGSPRTRPTSS